LDHWKETGEARGRIEEGRGAVGANRFETFGIGRVHNLSDEEWFVWEETGERTNFAAGGGNCLRRSQRGRVFQSQSGLWGGGIMEKANKYSRQINSEGRMLDTRTDFHRSSGTTAEEKENLEQQSRRGERKHGEKLIHGPDQLRSKGNQGKGQDEGYHSRGPFRNPFSI